MNIFPKLNRKLRHVGDTAEWRLCCGCGVCLYICPNSNLELSDVLSDGIRPSVQNPSLCELCGECVYACPGVASPDQKKCPIVASASSRAPIVKWGNVIEIWESYATKQGLRWKGSSGGVITAILLYLLEKQEYYGVLQTGKSDQQAWKNVTKFSRTYEDLLAGVGSRYAPSSPCDNLDRIENAPGVCAFVGKGCDIQGLRKTERLRSRLWGKVGLALGIFCAGTPSTQGTLDLLRKYNIDPNNVKNLRYRGKGWPGEFNAELKDEKLPPLKLSYEESWGFLQKYRPIRCYLCPDGTAEFADISCGDAWYKKDEGNEPGRSLVLVRTERGKKILHGAVDAGYVELRRAPIEVLEESQINLLNKKRAIWGRLLAMRMLGVPTPKYEGYYLYENWLDLPLKEKVMSIAGTIRRIIQRKYYKPMGLSKEAEGTNSHDLYD